MQERIDQHLGRPTGGHPSHPTPAIVERAGAGVAWSVAVLAMPLNAAGPVRPWRDPLAPPPEQGAVATYL